MMRHIEIRGPNFIGWWFGVIIFTIWSLWEWSWGPIIAFISSYVLTAGTVLLVMYLLQRWED